MKHASRPVHVRYQDTTAERKVDKTHDHFAYAPVARVENFCKGQTCTYAENENILFSYLGTILK